MKRSTGKNPNAKKLKSLKRAVLLLLCSMFALAGLFVTVGSQSAKAAEPQQGSSKMKIVVDASGYNLYTYMAIPDVEWKVSTENNNDSWSGNERYNDTDYRVVLMKGDEVCDEIDSITENAYEDFKSKLNYSEPRHEAYYNITGGSKMYWEYNSTARFRLKDEAGTFTVRLYKGDDILQEKSFAVFRFRMHDSEGEVKRTCYWTEDETTEIGMHYLTSLVEEGMVVKGFSANNKEYEIGDDNNIDMFRQIAADSGNAEGTTIDLTPITAENPYKAPDFQIDEKTGKVTVYNKENAYCILNLSGSRGGIYLLGDVEDGFVHTHSAADAWDGLYEISLAAVESSKYEPFATYGEKKSVTYNPQTHLNPPSKIWWDEEKQGLARWEPVEGASSYLLRMITANTTIIWCPITDKTEYDFSSSITDVEHGAYRFQVSALSDDLTVVGHSQYTDVSDILGLSAESQTAIEKVQTAADAIRELSVTGEYTDEQAELVNTEVENLKAEYSQNADTRKKLCDAIQADRNTQTNIKAIAKAYADVNSITMKDPDVSDDVKIKTDNLAVIGAELNVDPGNSVQLKLTNPAKDPTYDDVWDSVLAFNMELVNGEGKKVDETTDLSIPVTIKIPVPDDMNQLTLRILHYVNGKDEPEIIRPTFEYINGQEMAVFTITHFSTFAFANLKEGNSDSNENGKTEDPGSSKDSSAVTDSGNPQQAITGTQTQPTTGNDDTQVKAPAKVKIKTAKVVKSKKIKVSWEEADADGYEICYAPDKKFKKAKKTKNTKAAGITLKKLKKGSTYYIRIRAYKNKSNGEKAYGSWSKTKKVKIK